MPQLHLSKNPLVRTSLLKWGVIFAIPPKFLKKRNDSLSQNVQVSGQGDLNEGDLSDS
jgi:hypothetical protein